MHACMYYGGMDTRIAIAIAPSLLDSVIGQAKGCSQSQAKDRTRAKAA